MEYKKYEYPAFNIYTVKTNRFKSCQMQIVFKSEASRQKALEQTFLADIMSDCSANYKSRKEVGKKLEELYQAQFYGVTNKTGNMLMTSFILNFLSPMYVSDDTYFEEIFKFPFEFILNPFINASEFDIKNFNVVKNRLKDEILGVKENINRTALKKALNNLGDTPSSYTVLGDLEDLEKITPKTLSFAYNELIVSPCDIYFIGNMDMDEVANKIFKYFKNNVIKTKEIPLYVENKKVKKVKKIVEHARFLETNLVNIYNISNLTQKEKTITMHFYNYLLGGGGLNTKLYQNLREKNSLCYSIRSMYLKYDNLLVIQTSIDKKDLDKARKLIDKAFKEMARGDISEVEIASAAQSFVLSLNLALDNQAGILNNYLFHEIDGLPLIEERIQMIKEVTKEEIVAISNKISPIISYVLEGSEE